MQKRNGSVEFLAGILIVAGVIGLLWNAGWVTHFKGFHFSHLLFPMQYMASGVREILLSWQMILIITGFLLITGRRKIGISLVIFGALMLVIKILPFHALAGSVFIPALLLFAGIHMIVKTTVGINH